MYKIVRSNQYLKVTAEYMMTARVYLEHVINPITNRCFCGRDADGWDIPYQEIEQPTLTEILTDKQRFCQQCVRAIKRSLA